MVRLRWNRVIRFSKAGIFCGLYFQGSIFQQLTKSLNEFVNCVKKISYKFYFFFFPINSWSNIQLIYIILFHALSHKDFPELQSITFQSKVVSSQPSNAAWRAILLQTCCKCHLPTFLRVLHQQNIKIQAYHLFEPLWITLKCIFSAEVSQHPQQIL